MLQSDMTRAAEPQIRKLPCEKQYTKVAYGKGVNCKGDTIKVFEYSQTNFNLK